MIGLRPVLGGGRPAGGGAVLARAEAYALARNYSGTGSWLDQSGNGHDAALPGGSNDPLFLTTQGGASYLYLPGVSGNYGAHPDIAALDIVGDIDIRVAVAMTDWTPSELKIVLAKYSAAGTRSYRLGVNTTGVLQFVWSANGTATGTSSSTAAPVIADAAGLLLRVAFDVDNGAAGNTATFYTKPFTASTVRADLRSHTGWTQLGDPVVSAGTTSIFSGSATLLTGSFGGGTTNMVDGRFYGAAIYNGIAGTEAVVIDYTDPSLYDTTRSTVSAVVGGQTVTISRGASGRKSVAVCAPLFLFGTDDYLEIADHADLDFAATDSFTVAVALRMYGTTANTAIIAKKTGLAVETGYALDRGTGGTAPEFTIADGTAESVAVGPTVTAGTLTMVAGRRRVSSDSTNAVCGGVAGSPTVDATTATLANAEALRIGRLSGAGTSYTDAEIVGWALFREALTDGEMAALSAVMTA